MSTRPRALLLIPLAIAGCTKPSLAPDASPGVAASSSVATAAPAPTSPSEGDAAAQRDAGGPRTVDQPAWPSGAKQELKLTWAVYPPVGEGESSKRKLELVARIGSVARRLDLGSVAGALFPQNQSVCGAEQVAYKKGKDDVAEITFYVGGSSTFTVHRAARDRLEVSNVAGSDGYCPENNCDVTTQLATIPIPSDVVIHEAITDISSPGKEAPFDCGDAKDSGAPTAVTISGAVRSTSPGFMPAAKNGGKTQGWIEVFGTWTMDPPLAAGQAPKDVLEIQEAPATITPALAPATGCTVTATGFTGTLGLNITATEPGCDSIKMLQVKVTTPLEVKTRAVWRATKTSVPVTIKLTPPPAH